MKSVKTIILSIAMILMVSACVPAPIIVGGVAGSGAVYTTTNDTIKDVFQISKESAFETFIGIFNREDAKIRLSSISDGKIEAVVGVSIVFVDIKPVNENSIKVTIKAKKHIEFVPDKETSVRIYRLFIKEVTK
jgi:hypothetical protein